MKGAIGAKVVKKGELSWLLCRLMHSLPSLLNPSRRMLYMFPFHSVAFGFFSNKLFCVTFLKDIRNSSYYIYS